MSRNKKKSLTTAAGLDTSEETCDFFIKLNEKSIN